ncbi:MAG: hypothetical protein Q8R98_15210 [Rubrivivax sp.]|nr:hypothetical protein [Rubrivivax sp.]MDP3613204.1 hypothetical protein [Rubrivivax sp.]
MSLRKRIRVRIIVMLSMVLLFAQMAMAAYACPAIGDRADGPAPDMAGVPCAEMMAEGIQLDPDQPTLCMQHCQFGSVSHAVDPVPLVVVPLTALPALFTLSVDDRLDHALSSWAQDERVRDRPSPLAHSIAHCCFRI